MRGDAVHRRRHAVLAHPVMDVAAGEIAGADARSGPWPWCCSTASDRPSRRAVRARPAPARRAPRPKPGASRAWRSWREIRRTAAAIAASRPGRQFAALAAQELGAPVRRRARRAAPPRRGAPARRGRRPRATRRGRRRARQKAGIPSRAARAPPAISSAPSGAPCAAAVPALVGAPKAMIVRQAIRLGRSLSLGAPDRGGDRVGDPGRRPARPPSHAPRNRATWSSETARLVGPSIEIELSSHSTISLLSRRWPASDIASWLMPSIRQPSPQKT